MLLERLFGLSLLFGPLLLQVGFHLGDVSRYRQVSLLDCLKQSHLGRAFGFGGREAIVKQLCFIPVSRAVLGSIGAAPIEVGFEFRNGGTTVSIVTARFDVEVAAV